MPAYTTAKAGVEGLTRGMARDLAGPDPGEHRDTWLDHDRAADQALADAEAEENLIRGQCLKDKLAGGCHALVLWLARTTAGCARRNCGSLMAGSEGLSLRAKRSNLDRGALGAGLLRFARNDRIP